MGGADALRRSAWEGSTPASGTQLQSNRSVGGDLGGRHGGWEPQMGEKLPDHDGVLDGGDDAHAGATSRTVRHVHRERVAQQVRPRPPARRGRRGDCMPRASRERTRTGRRRAPAEATEGPRMQTTTIALDEDTHWRLRQLALDQRTSFRELIRTAIAEYLRRHEGGR